MNLLDSLTGKLHPKLKIFFEACVKYEMILLVHVGEEHSVDAGFLDNSLGNPLMLRPALDMGVKIIAAHVASEGENVDIEDENYFQDDTKFHIAKICKSNKIVESIDLLLRLMNDKKYDKLLFSDISATILFKRIPTLKRIMEAVHLHHRLIYGTDYPLPGIKPLIKVYKLKNFLPN